MHALPTDVPAPPERFNVAAHLLALNRGRASHTAYIDDRRQISYGELDEAVRRCASGLLALGLRREERVLMVMHDSIDFPIAFLGAIYAGLVPVPVNTLLTVADYRYMLGHARAQAVLVSAPLAASLRQVVADSGRPVPLLVSGTTDPADTAGP